MSSESIYDTLLELPLFRGVSREKISEIAEKAKFHFLKFSPESLIIPPGEDCTHLRFVIGGHVRSSITSHDGRFSVSQTLSGPDVIMPEYLFGRTTIYPCVVKAITPASILQIVKADYLKILNTDEIFLLNYLNYLSMNAQKSIDGVLTRVAGSIETRLAYWILTLTQPNARDIVIQTHDTRLAEILGVDEAYLMRVLSSMRDRGLIDFTPDRINVNERRELLSI